VPCLLPLLQIERHYVNIIVSDISIAVHDYEALLTTYSITAAAIGVIL